jgi:hypothetical protein
MSPTEQQVLKALVQGERYEGTFGVFNFAYLSEETGLERPQVRRACRSLARKGLAEFFKGLWSDEGKPAGSGYAATHAGEDILDQMPWIKNVPSRSES